MLKSIYDTAMFRWLTHPSSIYERIQRSRELFNLILGICIKFLAVGVGIFINRLINNSLSSNDYATFNYALSLSPIIISFIELGIGNIISKQYTIESDIKKREYIWINVNILRFMTYFIGILCIVFSGLFVDHRNLLIVCMLFTAQFILFADQNFRAVSATQNRNISFSITDLGGKIVLCVLLFFIVTYQSSTLLAVSGVYIVAYITTYMGDVCANRSYIKWNFSLFDRAFIKKYYASMLYLGLFSIMVGLYNTMDRVILSHVVPKDAFNGYTNAYRLFEVATLIPGISFPVIASKIKQSELQGKSVLRKYMTYSLLVSVVLSACFILLAPFGMLIIDNTKLYYEYSMQVYWIIGLSLLCVSFIGTLNHLILFEHKEKELFYIHAAIAVFAIVLYITTIPPFGILGAAISSLLVYFFDVGIKSLYFLRLRAHTHQRESKQ